MATTKSPKTRNRAAQDATLINVRKLWKHVAALEHNAKNLKRHVADLERRVKALERKK